MRNKIYSLISLIWVVAIDSIGWGIAFFVFSAMFLNHHTGILDKSIPNTTRYILYESLLAIYSLLMFFFAPVLGGLADKYGRKLGLKISMIGLTCGFIFCAFGSFYGSLILLFLGRVVSGITAGSLSIAQAAAIDISEPKSKSFYLSILMLANSLGFSLGPLLGGLLEKITIAPVGTVTFTVGTILSLIGFFAISIFFKENYTPDPNAKKTHLINDFLNIKVAFCKPVLNIYLVSILFSMTAFGLFFSNIPIFLARNFSANNSLTSIILSAEAIIFSAALILSGKWLIQKFNKVKVVLYAQIVQFLAYMGFFLVIKSLPLDILLFSIISAFVGIMYIGLLTLVSDATDKNWQGRVMGVVAALASITWGVGPLLSGGMNHFSPEMPYLLSGIFMVIAFLPLCRSLLTTKNKVPIET